ncbi:hypothetical protein NUW58_g480 [Xylaria curta]|uniref:Uncharacterized protein n=2 Tax=Xylaria curta TaxID=42375 RepID=A0ACC1PQW0_9PEZI|nr:hypothetical protein NUW58_g503 [Xylaria curta]KAJ2997953.1 hypothetical protein NUW58_g480 [Xylaria curta]
MSDDVTCNYMNVKGVTSGTENLANIKSYWDASNVTATTRRRTPVPAKGVGYFSWRKLGGRFSGPSCETRAACDRKRELCRARGLHGSKREECCDGATWIFRYYKWFYRPAGPHRTTYHLQHTFAAHSYRKTFVFHPPAARISPVRKQ